MEELGLLVTMTLVLSVALASGWVASRLRLPVIVGYLVIGLVIGPYALGLVSDIADVETLATIGVVLLMFTLGIEFSFKALRQIGRVAVLGGIAQILATIGIGVGLGVALDFTLSEAVVFGFLISLSSTIIVLKVLMDRGELGSPHGRVMIGILLVQDLAVIPMIVAVTYLGGGREGLEGSLWRVIAEPIGFIIAMLVVGLLLLPALMRRTAGARSREIFLLSIIVLSLAAAFGAYYVGLSIAFGAFLAGLMVSESDYAYQALADVRPLRDIFAVLFFVSLGMLADPRFVVENPALVGTVLAVIIAGKFVVTAAIARIFRYSPKTTLFVGTGLFQIGEFSFILAALGLELGLLSNDIYVLVLTVAVITMLITPFSMGLVSGFYHRALKVRGVSQLLGARKDPAVPDEGNPMTSHAIVCGYGRMARPLADVLSRRNFSFLIIDIDPRVIDWARAQKVPYIYGDASNPDILQRAGLARARVLIIALPDPIAARLTAQHARRINPRIDIVARVHRDEDSETFRSLGVAEMVRPEVEAGLEIIRHTLHRFGLAGQEIQYIINTLRQEEV